MPDIKAREPSLARTALERAARVAAPKVTFPSKIDPKAAAQFDIDVNTFDTYHAETTLKNTNAALAPFKNPNGYAPSQHFDVFLSLHTRAMNPQIDRTKKKYAAVAQVIVDAEAQINAAWNASKAQAVPLTTDARQHLTALQGAMRVDAHRW